LTPSKNMWDWDPPTGVPIPDSPTAREENVENWGNLSPVDVEF
jgi:hypothetical protein